MNNIVVIPARSGSKRVPDKNIRSLGGVPLLAWSILAAKRADLINEIYVSTDSPVYAGIAKQWGAEVIMRPAELCTDEATGEDVIRHAVETVGPCDLIVQLLPTTPFRTNEMVSQAIRTMVDAGDNADSLRSVEEMEESAFKTFTMPQGKTFLKPLVSSLAEANLPNQAHPVTFRGNGYVDIVKSSNLDTTYWGSRCIGFVTPTVIEIDTMEQFRYAEWWVNHRRLREEVVFR